MANSNPEQPEPEITEFAEADEVIARFTLGKK